MNHLSKSALNGSLCNKWQLYIQIICVHIYPYFTIWIYKIIYFKFNILNCPYHLLLLCNFQFIQTKIYVTIIEERRRRKERNRDGGKERERGREGEKERERVRLAIKVFTKCMKTVQSGKFLRIIWSVGNYTYFQIKNNQKNDTKNWSSSPSKIMLIHRKGNIFRYILG